MKRKEGVQTTQHSPSIYLLHWNGNNAVIKTKEHVKKTHAEWETDSNWTVTDIGVGQEYQRILQRTDADSSSSCHENGAEVV